MGFSTDLTLTMTKVEHIHLWLEATTSTWPCKVLLYKLEKVTSSRRTSWWIKRCPSGCTSQEKAAPMSRTICTSTFPLLGLWVGKVQTGFQFPWCPLEDPLVQGTTCTTVPDFFARMDLSYKGAIPSSYILCSDPWV